MVQMDRNQKESGGKEISLCLYSTNITMKSNMKDRLGHWEH